MEIGCKASAGGFTLRKASAQDLQQLLESMQSLVRSSALQWPHHQHPEVVFGGVHNSRTLGVAGQLCI